MISRILHSSCAVPKVCHLHDDSNSDVKFQIEDKSDHSKRTREQEQKTAKMISRVILI